MHTVTLNTISSRPTTMGLMRILRPNSGIATALSKRAVAMIGNGSVPSGIVQASLGL